MGRTCIVVVVALTSLLVSAADSAAALALDWKISFVSPANGSAFQEKSAVTLHCEWNAVIASSGNWDTPIEWAGFFTVDGQIFTFFKRKYAPNNHFYMSPATGAGDATNEFHGVAETTWTASGVGPHKVGCTIAQTSTQPSATLESTSKQANNSKETSIVVNPIGQVDPGRFPHPPDPLRTRPPGDRQSVRPGGPILPKSLSITGAQAKIAPTCQSLTNVLTAVVTIKSSTLPVPSGKGTIYVKETGGANLYSGTLSLPAFGSNESKVVQIPVGTSSQFVSALPGQHQLAIFLDPVLENGQPAFTKPASPYQLSVTLPAGYCK